MRFEAPRIQFSPAATVANPKIGFHAAGLSVHLPQQVVRKPHIKGPAQIIIARPPQLLSRIPDGAESRPTGIENYGRRYTAEGGIELRYSDVERTLPVALGKFSLWFLSSVATYYAGCAWPPFEEFWWNVGANVVLIVIYALYIFPRHASLAQHRNPSRLHDPRRHGHLLDPEHAARHADLSPE